MPYQLKNRLVIGIASSALFDLSRSDKVFRTRGVAGYRDYQRRLRNTPLKPGEAFPFIRRLLSLNDLAPDDPLVEVIVLSKNSPDTGLRVCDRLFPKAYPAGTCWLRRTWMTTKPTSASRSTSTV